jgi:cytochrome c-type biogenesis protein CcsB
LELLFFQIAALMYVCGSIAYIVFLFYSSDERASVGFALTATGFACHTLSLMHRAIFSKFFPLTTPFDAISFFAWLVIILFFVIRYKEPSPVFEAIAAPTAAALMIVGVFISDQIARPLVPVLKSWWLPIHAVCALAGNGVFALMAGSGGMYIVQEKLIKKKRLGRMHRLLPSLETLDMINRRGLLIGFFLLTLGIVSGALWAQSAWGVFWTWDPKESWSLVTWFVYAGMAHQRLVLGRRGRRSAIMAIVGFGFVMFTFVGVSAFMSGHHSIQGVVK